MTFRTQDEKRARIRRILILLSVFFFIVCAIATTYTVVRSKGKRQPLRFCYFLFNREYYSMSPEEIEPNMCTHILIGYGVISNNNIIAPFDIRAVSDPVETWRLTVKLREHNPDLKILLSIGPKSLEFRNLFTNDTGITTFVQSAVDLINNFTFDGLDIHWEYPAMDGRPYEDRMNFINLVAKLSQAFNNRGRFWNKKKPLLTTAVAGAFTIMEVSYNIPELAKYVDYCLVMAYGFHLGVVPPTAEFFSPIYPREGGLKYLSLAYASELWIEKGMPREKLVLGIPFHGVTYRLMDPKYQDVGAPVTRSSTTIYSSSCLSRVANDRDPYNYVFHNRSLVPYLHNNYTFISYEDPASVTLKVQWILNHGFPGVMTYSLNFDDYRRSCAASKTAFPLQKAVYRAAAKWARKHRESSFFRRLLKQS